MNKKYDLKNRFIDYAVSIIDLSKYLPNPYAGQHILKQILRSGTSPAANYAEALSAESSADFIHKLKIALKELRETEIWLKIIDKTQMINNQNILNLIIKETDQLISILYASVSTARKNQN